MSNHETSDASNADQGEAGTDRMAVQWETNDDKWSLSKAFRGVFLGFFVTSALIAVFVLGVTYLVA